jgi:selenide,water dikinase
MENLKYVEPHIDRRPDVPGELVRILTDAQTSGGLLISVPSDKADMLADKIRQNGDDQAAIIGEITPKSEKMMVLSL